MKKGREKRKRNNRRKGKTTNGGEETDGNRNEMKVRKCKEIKIGRKIKILKGKRKPKERKKKM